MPGTNFYYYYYYFNVYTTILDSKQNKNNINLTLHLKELEKEEQTKPKVSRRKGIIKNRAEINEIETKKTIAKINKTKSWFFEKLNKIDKPLARLKKKRGRTQNNKIRNDNGEVTTDTAEIQSILGDYYKQLYDNEMAIIKKSRNNILFYPHLERVWIKGKGTLLH